jgi:hypothetical protein
MLAYNNDPAAKTAILAQLQRHYDADEFMKGRYWQDGKGCAVGCTIYSGNHKEYESRFGIPEVLARLEDNLFERLPNVLAKEWPLRFMRAIRPGTDLSGVWMKFMVFILISETGGVLRFAKTEEERFIIRGLAALFERGETDKKVWGDGEPRARGNF